jgi:predicted transcriptional regulator
MDLLLKLEKLGSLELEVLNYMVQTNEPKTLPNTRKALKKAENSNVSQPIKTLIEKKLLMKTNKTYKPQTGRRGALYEITDGGLGRYIVEKKKDFGKELDRYQNIHPNIRRLNQIYLSLEGYSKRDDLIIGSLSMTAALMSGGFSNDDIQAMGQTWLKKRVDEMPEEYQDRLGLVKKEPKRGFRVTKKRFTQARANMKKS